MSYVNMADLMMKQCITSIFGWEGTAKMLDKWLILLYILIVTQESHSAVYALIVLVKAEDKVSTCIYTQAQHQLYMSSALIVFVNTEFIKRFWYDLIITLPILWHHFMDLIQKLMTGHFWTNTSVMP